MKLNSLCPNLSLKLAPFPPSMAVVAAIWGGGDCSFAWCKLLLPLQHLPGERHTAGGILGLAHPGFLAILSDCGPEKKPEAISWTATQRIASVQGVFLSLTCTTGTMTNTKRKLAQLKCSPVAGASGEALHNCQIRKWRQLISFGAVLLRKHGEGKY